MKKYKRTVDHSWDFRGANTKEYTHCYHNYPAMMIPQIARRLIEEYKPEGAKRLLDPYCGSGTSLIEGMLAGLGVTGFDLNPLAVFISGVKCRTYNVKALETVFDYIKKHIGAYTDDMVKPADYKPIRNWQYWFAEDTFKKLHFIDWLIHDSIGLWEYDKIPYREFFYVPLVETVRETSFTRNGEFKRYRMPEEKLKNFKPDVFKIFIEKVERNLKGLKSFEEKLGDDASSHKGFSVLNVNSCDIFPGLKNVFESFYGYDMVVTSPPYGDSRTTVAYGEFSSWANHWLGFCGSESGTMLDKALMGGKTQKEEHFVSESVKESLDEIKAADTKRYYEVISFLNDYAKSIKSVAEMVNRNGVACYVVGNRTVKGVQIPLDYFTVEIFEQNGFEHVNTIVREFPTKRMPSKNSPSNVSGEKGNTMSNEYIVIMKKK